MGLNVLGTILPNTHIVKQDIVIDSVLAAPSTDQLGLHCGDTVGLYRVTEIRNGWRYLWDQMRSRHIFDPGAGSFIGNLTFAGISINNMSEANLRITTDPLVNFNDDDIIISVGINATSLDGRHLLLESGFAVMRDAGGEFLKTI